MSQSMLASEILRYYIESPSQIVGDLVHLYFNPLDWKVTFLGILSGEQLIKKHLLIPASSVKQVDVCSRRIFLKDDFHPNQTILLDEEDLPNTAHNIQNLNGFKIATAEHICGKVKDFLFNRETWKTEGLIIQTHLFPKKKRILIPLNQIREIRWSERKMLISSTKDEVEVIPEFDSEYLYNPEIRKTG